MSPNRKGESIMSPSRVHSSVRSTRGPSGRPLALAVALALAATPLWAQDATPDTSADKNADKKARTLPLADTVYDRFEIGITAIAKGSRYEKVLYVDDVVISDSPIHD